MEVWRKSCKLACEIYELSREGELAKDFGFRDQLRRSSVSVPSNIAEGFERDSDREFARSLRISKGSCGELRTQLYIAARIGYIDGEKMSEMVSRVEEVSRMLAGLIQRLSRS